MPKREKGPKHAIGTEPSMPAHVSVPTIPATGEEFSMPAKEIRTPDNQLQLTDAELEEEVAKMLTANNPEAPKALVRYIHKERCYKAEAMITQTMTHFAMEGWLLHIDSEEAKKQQDLDKVEEELRRKFINDMEKAGAEAAMDLDDSKELRNRFNFSERAAQTSILHPKSKETATEPPPTLQISGACCQSVIYNDYIQDQERMEAQERAAKAKVAAKKGVAQKEGAGLITTVQAEEKPVMRSQELAAAAKALERMVNQNTFADIAMDFKFWDDASDAFKPTSGSLLPLWKFTNERARRKSVTAIAWSPLHKDVFAVAYGSYDFLRPTTGLICVFALANPTYPEVAFPMDAGALTLAFHPQHASLLALGLYDGSIAIVDVSRPHTCGRPLLCRSSAGIKGHTEPVWQVSWEATEGNKALQLYSVASDGRVLLWTMSKSALDPEVAMVLAAPNSLADPAPRPAAGSCFDFNPVREDVYVVGTEEGAIHKCSKAYASEYLATFAGHGMAVYSVRWNAVHPTVFLSASADWTVKLWDAARGTEAVLTFDMGTAVGDVAWAPYSATVFAVAAADGRVSVFDLAQHKTQPLCCQKVVRKAALTKVAFNPCHPILLVGDDAGCITSLKLSPNLRRTVEPEAGQSREAADAARMTAVVDVALKSRVTARNDGMHAAPRR